MQPERVAPWRAVPIESSGEGDPGPMAPSGRLDEVQPVGSRDVLGCVVT